MSNNLPLTMQKFEDFLQSYEIVLEGFHPHLQKAFLEMVKNGGKRFRPSLIFSVVDAFAPILLENSYLPALAMECMHTYSLIHDDLPTMDNASFRRGFETLHSKYDETTAVLVGDALNTFSFYLLSISSLEPKVVLQLTKELSLNSGINGMILGQALDCHFENTKLSLEDLQTIHTNKTAKLIATSLVFGALIANIDKATTLKLKNFGLKLGLFFQIRDDYLDATSTTSALGKPAHNDTSKNSYTNLLGVEEVKKLLKVEKGKLLAMIEDFPPKLKANLLHLLHHYFED